jgi:alpha-1,3-glucosyltransferase
MGAIFFVLSLGFKQMTLYYAPAIGSYLLAKCLYLGTVKGYFFFSFARLMLSLKFLLASGWLFIRLALVTTSMFLLLFLPFLPPFASFPAILDPISRIFPFDRGLFEDKVANFWCASNVIFKWKAWASRGFLVKVSTFFTAMGFLPAVVGLLRAGIQHSQNLNKQAEVAVKKDQTPFLPLLTYALLSSSMSFFLFSFQVHEKTILLPLLPITLLLSGASVDSAVYLWGALVNNVAVFRYFLPFSMVGNVHSFGLFDSMWPLLKKDGLGVQYIATLLLWNRLIGYNPGRLRPRSFIQFLSIVSFSFVWQTCPFLNEK